jgi:hypothetical protein
MHSVVDLLSGAADAASRGAVLFETSLPGSGPGGGELGGHVRRGVMV